MTAAPERRSRSRSAESRWVACAAVAILTRGFRSPVTLDVPGGTLRVEWTPGERATLIGDAVVEFASTFG